MNTGYGMPSRRRLRGPLHARNRPPPSSFEESLSASPSQHHSEAPSSSSAMPPPSSTPSGKKREWNATIGRGGLGSLPWEQVGPSQQHSDFTRAEFSFQSGMGFPTSTSATSFASMPSSSSASSFTSFRQQPTPMSASPSSFRTAADVDESASYSTRGTIFSRGSQSAQAALRETSRATHGSNTAVVEDDPPRKRRRGLAGAIVDTALNAALYTGAAALTAYSLWTSWGQSGDTENQSHHPDAGPEADMGHVISQTKRPAVQNAGKVLRAPPGGLEEPPPPYCEDQSTPLKQQQQPSTPQSNSVRTRKVFVSSQRNRRRPTFQGSKTHRQGTPRKTLPGAFRSTTTPAAAGIASSSSQVLAPTEMTMSRSGSSSTFTEQDDADVAADDDAEEDEDDAMLSRFEAKMNALIAEGQAALNSTPVLQEADLREIDTPSPSLGIGTGARQHLSTRASQRFDASFDSPFAHRPAQQQETLNIPSHSTGVARSSSHPEQLSSHAAVLPEPVKRTFGTPSTGTGPHALRHSHSAFDFKFDARPQNAAPTGSTSPFVFGRSDSPAGTGTGSPSVRAARRVTDFGAAASSSPSSRIPRSISRKSTVLPRPPSHI